MDILMLLSAALLLTVMSRYITGRLRTLIW